MFSFLHLIYAGLKVPYSTPSHAQHNGGVEEDAVCGHQVLQDLLFLS